MSPGRARPAAGLARAAGIALAVADACAQAAVAMAALAVLACFFLVCYSVAMRYFFGSPLTWGDEVTGWLIVAVVMLAVADAQRRNENIGVDLLIEKSGPRLRRALVALGVAMVAACALMMTWQGVEMVQFSRMLDLRSNTLGSVAVWTVQTLVPLGSALMLVVALAQLVAIAAGRDPFLAEADKESDGITRGIE